MRRSEVLPPHRTLHLPVAPGSSPHHLRGPRKLTQAFQVSRDELVLAWMFLTTLQKIVVWRVMDLVIRGRCSGNFAANELHFVPL
jgi:hypothetical protein